MDLSPNETQVSQTIGMLKHEIDSALKASNEYNDNFVGKIDMDQLNRLVNINNMLKGAMKDIIKLEKLYNDQLNNNFANIENEIKNDAVCQLEELLKREKEERNVVLKHLLEFIGCLTFYSQRGDEFSTDGDPNYVFANTHKINGKYLSISRRTLCYMIEFLLDILNDYVITDIGSKYVYFMYADEVYLVESHKYPLLKQDTYSCIKRVDINEEDKISTIVILKTLYDEYVKNKFKED